MLKCVIVQVALNFSGLFSFLCLLRSLLGCHISLSACGSFDVADCEVRGASMDHAMDLVRCFSWDIPNFKGEAIQKGGFSGCELVHDNLVKYFCA